MGRFPNKYVIGLTGNIAVGKSVVRKMLQHLGAYTLDADALVHQAMMPGAPAYKPIVEAFGQFIVGADGRIDRSLLGKIVFSNPQALKRLEQITHPVVRQAIQVLVNRAQQRVVVIEAIKLLEGELADWVDSVWVVDATPQTQYKRLVQERKMSEADAKQRIQAQNAQADKLKRANVIIKNDGNVDDTWKQVQQHFANVRKALAGGAAAAGGQAAKAAEAEEEAPQEAVADMSGVTVKRGTPNNAQHIADFLSKVKGETISRMDVMMAFGQKSFLIAQREDETVIATLGWTVENLVTRMDDFYTAPGVPVAPLVKAVMTAVEAASSELQSEVGFIFMPPNTPATLLSSFASSGYAPITLKEIKIPAWREAVEEATRGTERIVLWKQLRKDRVLQPI